MKFKELEIKKKEDLYFGHAPKPVTTRRGLVIGGGIVYPELNFTLPAISVDIGNMNEISKHYTQIVSGALERAVDLNSKGLIIEFETLIEMTRTPEIGIELVKIMNGICEDYFRRYGLKTEIRLTPNDLREFDRPPRLRTSSYLAPMFELFEKGAEAGGDLLSIESTGGKEISDDAIMMGDMKKFIFSQAVLGVRDMKMLWRKICDLAHALNKIPAGDTACAFGNTAMVLAEKKYISKTFAAVARIATVVRTLVAIEEGARGPSKDCGYEGPFLKAITGIPISMEGKTAACAHTSPVGNVAAACADLWSNESVQNIKLLSGYAPTVYYEQLEYDTRLMNQAIKKGTQSVLDLQELLVDSDVCHDPQALILAPENVIEISKEIVRGSNYVEGAVLGCLKGLDIIQKATSSGQMKHDEKEDVWIRTLRADIESIPPDEEKFIEEVLPFLDQNKIILSEYGL
jgi:methanol--5-hydroxybenzimidazolylcobamide Co-methyltransferase